MPLSDLYSISLVLRESVRRHGDHIVPVVGRGPLESCISETFSATAANGSTAEATKAGIKGNIPSKKRMSLGRSNHIGKQLFVKRLETSHHDRLPAK